MTRSKLSDLEKQEIVSLFEQQQETIASLAQRYQVSSSTIRRLLKQPLTEASPAMVASESQEVSPQPGWVPKDPPLKSSLSQSAAPPEGHLEASLSPSLEPLPDDGRPTQKPMKSIKRRSSVQAAVEIDPNLDSSDDSPAKRVSSPPILKTTALDDADSFLTSSSPAQDEISAILEDIGAERAFMSSVVEEDEDETDEDFDDLEDESDDLEDADELSIGSPTLQIKTGGFIEVMPLEEAVLPKTCYLVIDRTAELVTRPLKDFGELGQVPEHEVQSCTLPVFDNHRIARRFSHRTQRIIKIPNGNMLKTTCTQLSAKGITRLLVNGHIYAL